MSRVVAAESQRAIVPAAMQPAKSARGEAAWTRGTNAGTRHRGEVRQKRSAILDPPAEALPIEPAKGDADRRHASRPESGTSAGEDAEIIDTAFGGVFYLINVALALGLYGDFTRPLQAGLKLSIWDFLALTGDRLTRGRLRSDPLWPLLARLAGRSMEDVPGRHFLPAADWRVPASWLHEFSRAERWKWSVSHGRLRIEHPAGFAVAQVGLRGRSVRRRLERLLRQYRQYAPTEAVRGRAAHTHRGEVTDRLERWLDLLVEYLRARLTLALVVADGADAGTTLCAQCSRITVRPASIEVSSHLESLLIAIRMAGLDRDPGWVPAAGRSMRFHFG